MELWHPYFSKYCEYSDLTDCEKKEIGDRKNGEIIGLVIMAVIFLFGLLRYLVLNEGAS